MTECVPQGPRQRGCRMEHGRRAGAESSETLNTWMCVPMRVCQACNPRVSGARRTDLCSYILILSTGCLL
eukprot:1855592-Pyramimonas_sp.AAC.1